MSNVEPTVNVGTIGHVDNDKSTLTEVVVVCGEGVPAVIARKILEEYPIPVIDDPVGPDPVFDDNLQDWQQPGKRRMGRPR
jgi:hypothetical protein